MGSSRNRDITKQHRFTRLIAVRNASRLAALDWIRMQEHVTTLSIVKGLSVHNTTARKIVDDLEAMGFIAYSHDITVSLKPLIRSRCWKAVEGKTDEERCFPTMWNGVDIRSDPDLMQTATDCIIDGREMGERPPTVVNVHRDPLVALLMGNGPAPSMMSR